MKTFGNVLWLLLCGVWMSVVYFIAGVVGILFIITIPFGKANVKFARMILTSFGLRVVDEIDMTDSAVLIVDQLGVVTPDPIRYQ